MSGNIRVPPPQGVSFETQLEADSGWILVGMREEPPQRTGTMDAGAGPQRTVTATSSGANGSVHLDDGPLSTLPSHPLTTELPLVGRAHPLDLSPPPVSPPRTPSSPRASVEVDAMYRNIEPPTLEDDGADHSAEVDGLTEFVRDTLVDGRAPLDNIILQVYERGGLHLPTARIEEILRNACAIAPGSPDPQPLLDAWAMFRYNTHLNPRTNPRLYTLLQDGNYHNNYGWGDCQLYALITSDNLIHSRPFNDGMENRLRAIRTQQDLRESLIGIFVEQMADLEGGKELRQQFADALLINELGGVRIGTFEEWERELFIQYGSNPIPANDETFALLRDFSPHLTQAELPAALERVQNNIAQVLHTYIESLGRRGTRNNQFELALAARYYQRAIILLDYEVIESSLFGFGAPKLAQVHHCAITGQQYLPPPEHLHDRVPLVIGRWPGHYVTPTAPFGLAH